MRKSDTRRRAELKLNSAAHRKARLEHQRDLLRQRIVRAMALQEDRRELEAEYRALEAEWRQAYDEVVSARSALQELAA